MQNDAKCGELGISSHAAARNMASDPNPATSKGVALQAGTSKACQIDDCAAGAVAQKPRDDA